MNNTITEIKNTLEGTKSRITEAEEQIGELEDRMVNSAEEQSKGKRMKSIEDSFRDFWDSIKCTNIRIIGVLEGKEKKKGTEKCFEETILENIPKMGKETIKSKESPIQDKSKEQHAEIHTNQANRD